VLGAALKLIGLNSTTAWKTPSDREEGSRARGDGGNPGIRRKENTSGE